MISALRFIKTVLAVLIISALLTACGTKKKFQQQSTQIIASHDIASNSNEARKTETKQFGDSLKGSTFLPSLPTKKNSQKPSRLPGSKGNKKTSEKKNENRNVQTLHSGYLFEAESKGVKLLFNLTPVFDNNGLNAGFSLDYEAIAKPTSITTEESSTGKSSTNKLSQNINMNASEEVRKAFGLAWYTWLLIFLVLIAGVLFRGWLPKFLFNGK